MDSSEISLLFEVASLKLFASYGFKLWAAQVIRIQPDEAIYLKINNKIPGLGLRLDSSKLDLTYKARYNTHLPDAYERLILDVINGDKRLFIRNDELEAAWALFTPILKVCPYPTFWASVVVTKACIKANRQSSPIMLGCLRGPNG